MVIPCKTDYIDEPEDSSKISVFGKRPKLPKHYRKALSNESVMTPTPTPYPHRDVKAFDVAGDFDSDALNIMINELNNIEDEENAKISIKVKINNKETKWLEINKTILDTFVETARNFSDVFVISDID